MTAGVNSISVQDFVRKMNIAWITVGDDGGIDIDCVAARIALNWPPTREAQDAVERGVLDTFRKLGVPQEKMTVTYEKRRPQVG